MTRDSRRHRNVLVFTAALSLLLSPLPEPPARAGGASVLSIRAGESEVRFLMNTTWHDVIGVTHAVAGTIESASGDPFLDGIVRVSIEAATLDTGNKRRDATMRRDYLETDRHPSIEFASTAPPESVSTVTGADGVITKVSLDLTGDLTIHGETRRVRIPVVVTPEAGSWRVEGEAIVLLSDYAIPDPSLWVNRVKDAVTVSFSVKAGVPSDGPRLTPEAGHG